MGILIKESFISVFSEELYFDVATFDEVNCLDM